MTTRPILGDSTVVSPTDATVRDQKVTFKLFYSFFRSGIKLEIDPAASKLKTMISEPTKYGEAPSDNRCRNQKSNWSDQSKLMMYNSFLCSDIRSKPAKRFFVPVRCSLKRVICLGRGE